LAATNYYSATFYVTIDDNVIIGRMPNLFDEADLINISVTFTWDIPFAESLFNSWRHIANTLIGGPAFNELSGEFEPGKYLKEGYVITSRGCPNKCWFCSVWKREGNIRELSIKDGWIITDDNLLACSNQHIIKVFEMLKEQPFKAQFTGGLEAKLLTPERAKQLKEIKPERIYFAYDTEDDLDPLIQAGKYLWDAGFIKHDHDIRAYVLIGYPKDTFQKAEKRIKETWDAGFFPMAMLWRNEKGEYKEDWKKFQRLWANPTITAFNLK
jgi:hypothetical protein